jgi:chromate transporter
MSLQAPSFLEAFWFWLKLGFISFGGPAGQIATMHQELVEKKKWVTEESFMHALNYCMLLPGPEAQQLATYLGWLMHRTWGGIVAGALFILPSLFILIALSWLYISFGHNQWINAVFDAIKPAVVAIVFHAAYRIGKKTLRNLSLALTSAASFVAIYFFNVPFPWIILVAGLLGYLSSQNRQAMAPIASDSIQHIQNFQTKTFFKHLSIGLSLWLIPIVSLFLIFGWANTYTQMSWFFTKAALVTFGGAYAVLPYVYQASIEQFQWLSATQMLDGLALGESTPGPLIMIVAFAGFIAGHSQELLGPEYSFMAGAFGALIATWFTFLPSFLFILLGAPLVKSSENNSKYAKPLQFITAAVVGVIINLGIFFTSHIFWTNDFTQYPNLLSVAIAIVSGWALFRQQYSIVKIISIAACIGIISKALPYINI